MKHTGDGDRTHESGQTTGPYTAGAHADRTTPPGGSPVQGVPRRGGAGEQTGSQRPASRQSSGGRAGSTATLRVVAAVFGLLGGLSAYGGLKILQASGDVPVAGSGLELFGFVSLAVGAAHLYAAYGLWTHRLRGWQVAAWLVCAGALLNLVVLLAGGAAVAVVGLLVNGALGWGLHTNRAPFRDHREPATRGADTAGPGAAERPAGDGSYASERRGRG